jgi:hypothetical protein
MPALSPRMRTLMLLTATAVLAACMAYAKLSVDTHKAQLRSLHLAHELQVRLSLSHCPHISFNAHHSATTQKPPSAPLGWPGHVHQRVERVTGLPASRFCCEHAHQRF